jgi:hypothetical protein
MSPSTRTLLAAAREGLGPDPAAAARVRAKLDLALAGTAAAAPAAATGGLALKLAAIAIVAGAVAVVAVPRHASTPTSAPALPLDETAHLDVPAPTVQAAAREPAAPVPVKQPALVHVVAASPAPAPAPVVEVTLAREVELIDDAMASLHSGDATAALAAIAAFQRETAGHGQLLEEASAIEVEASCKLHLDVTDKLAAFDRAWPSSPERARLTAACPASDLRIVRRGCSGTSAHGDCRTP